MANVLYLPSTPLNVLVSAALANARRETDQAELWLIDQKQLDNNPYLQALQNWPQSPFKQIRILPGKAKGRAKLAERKQNFQTIDQGLAQFQPNIIATGSDRRIEFQYAMHQLKKLQPAAQGWYLDDGLYSYAGRPYHPIKDGINSLIKKLSYGLWWQEPKTVGASNWINQAWLFRPGKVIDALQAKPYSTLASELFTAPEVRAFSQSVLSVFNYHGHVLSHLNAILIFPHPNDMAKMAGYEAKVKKLVSILIEAGFHIGIKYHPRQVESDFLNLTQHERVVLIPAQIAFEFILPFIQADTLVVADVCTALMTAKWLGSDLEIAAVLDQQDAYQLQFVGVMEKLDIKRYLSYDELLNELKEK